MSKVITPAKHTATGNVIRKPFHMLGSLVKSYAQACAVVGFTITQAPVINPLNSKPIPNSIGLFRSDTQACIGVNSKRFTFKQPAESLAVMEQAAGQVGAQWASADSHRGGSMVSAFATLDTCIIPPKRGDKVGLSLMLLDYFDGSGLMQVKLCANVLACDNGMVSSRNLCGFRQKHNGALTDRFDVFAGSLAMSLQLEIDSMQGQVAKLDNTPMTQSEVEPFARALFNVEPNTPLADLPGQQRNRLESIITGFSRGTGNVGRTRWDMFNAVTEHLDHNAHYRATENTQADNRFVSLTTGDGAKVRDRALALLLA